MFFDRDGNNPYCHHRSLHHAARGVQERLRLRDRASGVPFDNGVFEISIEPFERGKDPDGFALEQVQWPAAWLEEEPDLAERLGRERDRTIEVWQRTRLGIDGATAASSGA